MIKRLNETDTPTFLSKVAAVNVGRTLYAHVITFGCQQNEADSERMAGLLCDMGYRLSDTPNNADLILMNTCAIREHAEAKALSMLGGFKALKRKNPELIIGVCGCMAAEAVMIDKLKKDFHYVDFTMEPSALHRLPELIYNTVSSRRRAFLDPPSLGEALDIVEDIPTVRQSGHKAWVSVMYGCNNFCTYCIVPYTRGRERSRSSGDILEECRSLVAGGVKEITLLGQNVNSYRSDMDFAELLESIAMLDGDFILRFMTSHPKDTSDKLISVMAKYTPKIAPYFHLPLQSGSDHVLKRMNRTYNSEKYLEIAEKLRQKIPNISISTDVIVGFPGEGDEDFRATLDVLSRVRFDLVYSFLYSPRSGTPAAKMDGAVPEKIMNARMAELLALQDGISLERNQSYLGTVQRVLVDSKAKRGENTYTAHTDTAKTVHFTSDSDHVGKFVDLKIEKVGAFEMFGTLIK